LVLKQMFPPEKIKTIVLAKVSENLNREATLDEVKIGLWSGISLTGFALSETPNFKKGTFIQSEGFILKFQLLPLLQKKFIIDRVELIKPKINIIQYKDGKTFNFSDLTEDADSPDKKETTKSEPGEESISLTIAKLKIENGSVRFIDRSPSRIKATLDPINISLTGTQLDKPMAIEFSTTLDAVIDKEKIKGDLKSNLLLLMAEQTVKLESLSWKMPGLETNVKGNIKNFSNPNINLSLSIHNVELPKLKRWIELPKEVQITGSPEIGLELNGTQNNLKIQSSVELTQTGIKYLNDFNKKAGTECSLELKGRLLKQNNLNLEKLDIKMGSLDMKISGKVTGLTEKDTQLTMILNVNPFQLNSLSQLTPLANEYKPTGKFSLQSKINGNLSRMESAKIYGSADLSNVEVFSDPYQISSLTGKLEFKFTPTETLQFKKLTGKISRKGMSPTDFEIATTIKNLSRPDISLTAKLSPLNLDLFLAEDEKSKTKGSKETAAKSGKTGPDGPPMSLRGKIEIKKILYSKFEGNNAVAHWNLTGVTPSLKKINGKADFKMVNGKIKNIPLLKKIAPILKIDPSGLAFTKMSGNLVFKKGTATTKDFIVLSPVANLIAIGDIYLPTNNPNLTLTAKLPKGTVGGTLGQFTNDSKGRPTFKFILKDSWTPKLDMTQIKQQAKKEIKKKATNLLKNEGKKLLEGFLKR